MKNNNSEDKNRSFNPILIVVLVITIIALAWLSIRLVNILPGAFSSLASLAETINQQPSSDDDLNTNEEIDYLNVNTDSSITEVNEEINISWESLEQPGDYVFSYRCAEGLSLEMLNPTDNSTSLLDCEVEYTIENPSEFIILAESAKNRLATVNYSINFIPESSTIVAATGNDSFVVINPDIVEETEEEPTENGDDVSETETNQPEPEVTYEQEFAYITPVSDPNGRTDLGVRFLESGRIVGNRFFAGDIEKNESGAIQFEVKNYGSKTSAEWNYNISLPIGANYESGDQEPLKPNERAVITIGFTADNDSRHEFIVTVDEDTDRNELNDGFRQTVRFIN